MSQVPLPSAGMHGHMNYMNVEEGKCQEHLQQDNFSFQHSRGNSVHGANIPPHCGSNAAQHGAVANVYPVAPAYPYADDQYPKDIC